MLPALIDERRDWAVADVIEPAAVQAEALLAQVLHSR
jgi:hypothetical protein